MNETPADSPSLIVMYHYVRPDDSIIPGGIRPLLVSEFERQLDWLGERYEIVRADQFLSKCAAWHANSVGQRAENDPLRGARGLKPPCLLTFDDGTKDHFEIVTPILAHRGLAGLFFVLTWPAELKKMPLTHAVHWLLSGDDETVWEQFSRHARDHLGSIAALGDPAEARRIYHYESPTRGRIKYAANMALPVHDTECIVEAAVLAGGRTMGDLAEEWFVSANDIRAMNGSGMTIGLHGCSHRSLQTLGASGISEEIHHASAYVNGLVGALPTWYACPFGGAGATPEAVSGMRSSMRDAGIVASVSTEKRHVRFDDDPYALPRLDTIDLPPRNLAGSIR